MHIEARIRSLEKQALLNSLRMRLQSKRIAALYESLTNYRYTHKNYMQKLRSKHKEQYHILSAAAKYSKLSSDEINRLKKLAGRFDRIYSNVGRTFSQGKVAVFLTPGEWHRLHRILKERNQG